MACARAAPSSQRSSRQLGPTLPSTGCHSRSWISKSKSSLRPMLLQSHSSTCQSGKGRRRDRSRTGVGVPPGQSDQPPAACTPARQPPWSPHDRRLDQFGTGPHASGGTSSIPCAGEWRSAFATGALPTAPAVAVPVLTFAPPPPAAVVPGTLAPPAPRESGGERVARLTNPRAAPAVHQHESAAQTCTSAG